MARKAAIFHSAWRYSETELSRSIAAIAFQIAYAVLNIIGLNRPLWYVSPRTIIKRRILLAREDTNQGS